MDRDTIIRLAREAEGDEQHHGMWRMHVEDLERFAALVAAHEREELRRLYRDNQFVKHDLYDCAKACEQIAAAEREECAKVCDAVDSLIGAIESVGMQAGARKVLTKACEDAASVAAAIRSRT